MEITFNYIRNRIREHSKQDLLQACYNILDDKKDEKSKPLWYIFLLMKWTYLYGGQKYPSKPLTQQNISNIFKSITELNKDYIGNYIGSGEILRAFHILYSQQFYLQTYVTIDKFATQLKLYCTLKSKYDIDKSFLSTTGFSILDFLKIMQLTWLCINIGKLKKPRLYFNGYLEDDFLRAISKFTEKEKVIKFLQLLVLDPVNPNEKIKQFKQGLRNEEYQSLEKSFFTLYPFQYFNSKIRVIHSSIFNYTANYYIYDYLKSNDDQFTTEFGLRFEKYIECGIKELKYAYITEKGLKERLPKNSNLVDFYIEESNIFIECKAVELQPYPSSNPSDDVIYNSLKDSLIKAYFNQLLPVSKILKGKDENWGIILTYKKLYWGQYTDLYNLGIKNQKEKIDSTHLPPENVFLIDIHTWDRIVNIITDEKTSLLEILKLAKRNNSKPETFKQNFDMHLDNFKRNPLKLSYLQKEREELNLVVK